MKRTFSVFLFFLSCALFTVHAQKSEMYRLTLTDKGHPSYDIDHPDAFLSQKSIDRRLKQGFKVNETDLPIDPAYFDALVLAGAGIQTHSKWVNTIVVNAPDSTVLIHLTQLPFVKKITKVWEGKLEGNEGNERNEENEGNEGNEEEDKKQEYKKQEEYGEALVQIKINNALPLHERGYKGEGKTIAVLDGGFSNANRYPDFLDMSKILEVKNFTHQKEDLFLSNESHGTSVLSCMLANNPGKMIGTAPQAQFYLFKTEVGTDEYPVEEDYWIAALEYADSLGVDIVSSSLGYSSFIDSTMNHTWDDLDGHTVPVSRAASMAASKGMVLFVSAGNEGAKPWQKVNIPSDAENVLTVGAIKTDSTRAEFSSWGMTADNRFKPDVMALGKDACILTGAGTTAHSNGTSFSTPILAGMGACLWEALPYLTSFELIDLIKESSDRFSNPDEQFGYGIPDIYRAYLCEETPPFDFIYPVTKENATGWLQVDSINGRLRFNLNKGIKSYYLTICSYGGEIVLRQYLFSDSVDISYLPKGVYIAWMQSGEEHLTQKFIKQ
jgi:subtilisin family serine protease